MEYNKNLDLIFNDYIYILNKLNEGGFQAYIVGGSLRDAVMGLKANDVDITTNATPEEVIKVFEGYQIMPIGIEHGTVAIILNKEQIEITTFRNDGEYSDHRRPDNVEFTNNLEEDLQRRDFTINALAYNKKEGLIDLMDGLKDIENKTIKAVGEPSERFIEDPLRILRGLRFASKLGFEIERETEKAMFETKHLLKKVSAERIQKEFNGLLLGNNAKEILLKYSLIIAEFIPEIKPMIGFNQRNPYHRLDLWEHTCKVVDNSNNILAHKLAALLHDIGKVNTFTWSEKKGYASYINHEVESVVLAKPILSRLRYDNKTINRVLNIITDHMHGLSTKPYKVKKAIFELGIDRFQDMIEFNKADDLSKDLTYKNDLYKYEIINKISEGYLENSPILSHKDLSVTAKDLMNLGIQGKQLGEVLRELCLLVISGHSNDKESQIKYIEKNIIKQS